MNDRCLKCDAPTIKGHKYCGMSCRSAYLSQMMIRKSKNIKKRWGNNYWVNGKKDKNIKA